MNDFTKDAITTAGNSAYNQAETKRDFMWYYLGCLLVEGLLAIAEAIQEAGRNPGAKVDKIAE